MNGGEAVPDTRTVTWIDERGNVVSLEVPADVAEKIANGEMVSFRTEAEPVRRTKAEALEEIADERAALLARKDQVEAERDAMVSRFPELKAAPRRIPPDDAA